MSGVIEDTYEIVLVVYTMLTLLDEDDEFYHDWTCSFVVLV